MYAWAYMQNARAVILSADRKHALSIDHYAAAVATIAVAYCLIAKLPAQRPAVQRYAPSSCCRHGCYHRRDRPLA
jgi:hypothetical protein